MKNVATFKGKPPKKDLPLLKSDITNNLEPKKPVPLDLFAG
jgi:hypothetical protein